jgi:Tol biopolymer transport system component
VDGIPGRTTSELPPRWRTIGCCCVLTVLAAVCALCSNATPAMATQFGVYGEGAGEFFEPRGVAVEQESGDVYIVDSNNQRVEKWTNEGAFILAWGFGVLDGRNEAQTCTTECRKGFEGPPSEMAGSGQLNFPAGVALDNDPLSPSHGDVYVVDTRNNRVEKFSAGGEFILMFGGEVDKTTGANLCVVGSGDVCGGGLEGNANGQFEGGDSVAVDAEGHVLVGDASRVQRFSAAGVYEATVLTGVGRIDALAAVSGGNFYLINEEAGVRAVREYTAGGIEISPPRDAGGQPMAVAVDEGGNLFVDDEQQEAHHLLEYTPSGAERASFDAGMEEGSRGIAWGDTIGRLYVLNENDNLKAITAHVRVVSRPPPGALVVGSASAGEVEPTSATLHATVNPEGHETSYHFEYGTSEAYGSSAPTPEGSLAASFNDEPAEAALAGLTPSTTYHFRLVAKDSEGHIVDGLDQTFTTLPPMRIDNESIFDVASTSGTFAAQVDPLGAEGRYLIEYGTTVAYGLSTPEASLGSGFGAVSVSVHAQGLQAATTYHYRVVAHDERAGVPYMIDGEDRTFTTQPAGLPLQLPDGRAWELVSPPNKNGARLQALGEEGAIQAAGDGAAIAYVARSPIESSPEGSRAPEAAEVLSTHDAAGWASREIETENRVPDHVSVGQGFEYRLFSPDLSVALVEPRSDTPLPPLPATAEQTLYLRHSDGSYEALVTAGNTEGGAKFGGQLRFLSATADLSHVVFRSAVPLTSTNVRSGGLYEWVAGRLQLVSVLPNGEPAPISELGARAGHDMRAAISSDGTRVVWSAESDLYMRDTANGKTVQLDAVQGGSGSGEASAIYQTASADGSKVFFTDGQALTAESNGTDLYEYDVAHSKLTDLTVSISSGEGAEVQGLLPGVAEDGSDIYVVARGGVLTSTPNALGELATPGADNLYVLRAAGAEWKPTFIATLSSNDTPDWAGEEGSGVNLKGLTGLTSRVSPDGRWLAFMSERPLTGYDNRDVNGGVPDEEVFLYDATASKLLCASCNPTGARPTGLHDHSIGVEEPLVDAAGLWSAGAGSWLAASVPGWTPIATDLPGALYQSRYLSDNGRLFFNSGDALVPQAVNHTQNVYEYEPAGVGSCTEASPTFSERSRGCISLISSGTSGGESAFLDASKDGGDVFFLTTARLAPQDTDSSYDVYDAHECTSSWSCPGPSPVPVPPCSSAASCKAPATSTAGAVGLPASLTLVGAGNIMPSTPQPATKNALTRAQKLARALNVCRKKKDRRKRAACTRKAKRQYGANKSPKTAASKRGRV